MFVTILNVVAPLLIKVIAWVLDWVSAKDQTKKEFYRFIAVFESEHGVSVRLAVSRQDQLARARAQLEAEKQIPPT